MSVPQTPRTGARRSHAGVVVQGRPGPASNRPAFEQRARSGHPKGERHILLGRPVAPARRVKPLEVTTIKQPEVAGRGSGRLFTEREKPNSTQERAWNTIGMILQSSDIDDRSALLLGWTGENVARLTSTWPRTNTTPPAVHDLLAEARRLMMGSALCYDNLAAASLKALQAAEEALRLRLGDRAGARATLGQLLKTGGVNDVLDATQVAWFTEFALPFRNLLSHPHGSVAFTPGFAEPFLRTAHEIVGQLFPIRCEPIA